MGSRTTRHTQAENSRSRGLRRPGELAQSSSPPVLQPLRLRGDSDQGQVCRTPPDRLGLVRSKTMELSGTSAAANPTQPATLRPQPQPRRPSRTRVLLPGSRPPAPHFFSTDVNPLGAAAGCAQVSPKSVNDTSEALRSGSQSQTRWRRLTGR